MASIAIEQGADLAPVVPALKRVPGPRGLPVIGVGLAFLRDPLGMFERMVERYGRLFSLPLGQSRFVFLNDADHVEQILRRDFDSFGMSAKNEELLKPLLGRSMPVVADHGYWEKLHAILLPMFTPRMLQKYFVQTLAAIRDEAAHLDAVADAGETISLYAVAREGVFAALIRTMFVRGIDFAEIPQLLDWFGKADEYVNARALSGGSSLIMALPKVREGRRCLHRIDRRVRQLIAYRQANRAAEAEDMLDILLAARADEGAPLDDTELRDNVVALLFGGQETTPGAITWAIGLLAANPAKYALMIDEIDRVLQGRDPTFQDLAKLQYTEMVLDEAMRLYPPFAFMAREALTDTVIDGHAITKGTALGFVAWTVHRDPRHWPDPEAFIPERHTREARKDRAKCAFLSFGYGQRRCIGERVGRMEGVLMLAIMSQRFEFRHVGGRLPDHKVQMSIKPVNGMPMHVTRRALPPPA